MRTRTVPHPFSARLLKLPAMIVAAVMLTLTVAPAAARAADTVPMYRLYNPNSGEHLYTASVEERQALRKVGWRYERVGWVAPVKSNSPVYRLYNPFSGDHHYTLSKAEYDTLGRTGWKQEGTGWYSDDAKTVPLYRQFNRYVQIGTHNYTTSKNENDELVKIGWRAEGIAWYAAADGYAVADADKAPAQQAPSTNQGGSSGGSEAPEGQVDPVYVTKSGKKFHRQNCPTTKNSKGVQAISRAVAIEKGLEPCKDCRP